MDDILRDASRLVTGLGLRITGDGIVLHFLQVGNQIFEHRGERSSGKVHYLVIVRKGLCAVRHVAEGTDEVEVAQVAQCRHLGDVGLQVALGVTGVNLCHAGGILDDRVAAVDDIVEGIPLREAVHGGDVLLEHIVEVNIVVDILSRHNVIAADFAPDHHAVSDIGLQQGRVAAGDHILDIGLFVPEVLEDDFRLRLDFQEVGAAGQRESHESHESHKSHLIYIIYLSFHNLVSPLEVNSYTKRVRT